jgi:hypothetical protein
MDMTNKDVDFNCTNLLHIAPSPNIPMTTPNRFVLNLEDSLYRKEEGLSGTQLKTLQKSPYHLLYDSQNREEPTKEMKFGTAVHTAWLEPERFASLVVRSKKFDRRKPAEKEAALLFEQENVGKIILDDEEWERMDTMIANLNEAYGHLLSISEKEVSVFCKDEGTGLMLKGRLDLYCPATKTIYDLKTCEDASFRAFKSDFYKRDYALQCWHYTNVAKNAGLAVEKFVFIASEKKAPNLCNAYPVVFDLTFAHRWEEEYKALLKTWAEAKETNVFKKPSDSEPRTIVIS